MSILQYNPGPYIGIYWLWVKNIATVKYVIIIIDHEIILKQVLIITTYLAIANIN